MTEPVFSSGQREIEATVIDFPDQKIAWAGEGIVEDRFLFGSNNGFVLESGIHAPIKDARAVRVALDQESINGVAHSFADDELHLGVTTRTEIIVHRFSGGSINSQYQRLDFGAHGIKAGRNNYFVSAAGPSGLVVASMGRDPQHITLKPSRHAEAPYFYDCASLAHDTDSGAEIFVVACRTGGVMFASVSNNGKPSIIKASKIQSKIIDFIGVVSIGNASYPYAFIGLGKDRSMHFIRDFIHSPEIKSLEFPYIPGTAYKLLRHGEHLLLLTSKGLCLIHDIIKEYYDGKEIGGFRAVNFVHLDAIDFNIVFNRWLLIVSPGGVMRMDLSKMLPARQHAESPPIVRHRMNPISPRPLSTESASEETEEPVWRDTSLEARVLEPVA